MAKKNSVKLSWQEQGLISAKKLCKSKKSGLLVLTQSGDLVFKAGYAEKLDAVSVGALASGLEGARIQLDKLSGIKSKLSIFGDTKTGYWVESFGSWLVLGFRLPRNQALMSFYKHLKKKTDQSSRKTPEALSGLSDAGLDAALTGQ